MGSRDELAVALVGGDIDESTHSLRASSPTLAFAATGPAAGMVIVGELIGIIADGAVPLIRAAALGDAVLPARTIVDLHAAHVGREVVLAFEAADTSRPIVMGVLRGKCGWPFDQRAGHLDVHGEGERLIVGASEQLVLQCGKSSLVMSKDGHIELTGETIVSEAAGPNRVRGGSVHLN